MQRRTGRPAATLATLAAALAVSAGCGGSGHHDPGHGGDMPHDMLMASGSTMPPDMMADPSAVPAYQVAGAELRQAAFTLLDTRPPGSDTAAGTVWLAQDDRGTTVTIAMTGLQPGRQYIAHLHVRPCADAGGPHFRFDPAGPPTPPNEIHLGFIATRNGTVTGTVHNGRRVGDGASAVVMHPADALDNRLACADF